MLSRTVASLVPIVAIVLFACGDSPASEDASMTDAAIDAAGRDGSTDASDGSVGSELDGAPPDATIATCDEPLPDLFSATVYRDGFNWTSASCTAPARADDSACPAPTDGVESWVEGGVSPEILLDDPRCYGGEGGCIRMSWAGNETTQQFVPGRGQWAPGGESNGFFLRHRVKFDSDWYSPEGYWHGPQHLKYGRFCRGSDGCNDMKIELALGNDGAESPALRYGIGSTVRQRDGSICSYSIFGGSACPDLGISGALCAGTFAFVPDTFHTLEWYISLGEPGASNAACTLWIDGAMVQHEEGVELWGDPDPAVTGPLDSFKWIFANTSNAVGACDTEADHWPPCSTAPESRTLFLDDVCITEPDPNARLAEGACPACP